MVSQMSIINLILVLNLAFLATGKPIDPKSDCKINRMACKKGCEDRGLVFTKKGLKLENNVLECSCKDSAGNIVKIQIDWTSKPVESSGNTDDVNKDGTQALAGEIETQFPDPNLCYTFRNKKTKSLLVPSKRGLIDDQIQKYVLIGGESASLESAWKFINVGNGLYKIVNCKSNELLAWTAFTVANDPNMSYLFTIKSIPAIEELLRDVWSVETNGDWVRILDGANSVYVTDLKEDDEKVVSVTTLEGKDDSSQWKLEALPSTNGVDAHSENEEETHHEDDETTEETHHEDDETTEETHHEDDETTEGVETEETITEDVTGALPEEETEEHTDEEVTETHHDHDEETEPSTDEPEETTPEESEATTDDNHNVWDPWGIE